MAGPGARQLPLHDASNLGAARMVVERREPQKHYVFVDEKNRHRRLKVVRACDGCRKRKIKCDSANTNVWPCSACHKMKMQCIPPSLNFDDNEDGPDADFAAFEGASDPMENPSFHQAYPDPDSSSVDGTSYVSQTQSYYSPAAAAPASQPFFAASQSPGGSHFGSLGGPVAQTSFPAAQHQPLPLPQRASPMPSMSNISSAESDTGFGSEHTDAELSSALGSLALNQTGQAPYLTDLKSLSEAPAIQEYQPPLPQSVSSDSTVHIPPEMMPDANKANEYFRYYFTNVHPYIPVLTKAYFLRQWQSDRKSISPLILEGIFACASNLMGRSAECQRWLALATKHEESFKDVPRISTIQGLLILIKAREGVPKQGYFYRSYQSIVGLVLMAKDLGMNKHLAIHQRGRPCGASPIECAIKTRVWQALFMVELLIRGPQGRYDFAIAVDTVDLDGTSPLGGLDEQERQISEQQIYMNKAGRNVRRSIRLYQDLNVQKDDWALDSQFVQQDKDYESWLHDLPPLLQVTYPKDGSKLWIPFHYVGNLHAYHHLTIIMHHRPQLQASQSTYGERWKEQMLTCYSSAKTICQLQEAVIEHFGLAGLFCMQRGASMAIYSILTCTMLHMVTMSSPDPELNFDAAEFFERHMQILERCVPYSPVPGFDTQVEALRQAFSADLSLPFRLRRDLPFSPRRSEYSDASDSGTSWQAPHIEYPVALPTTSHEAYHGIPTSPPQPSDASIIGQGMSPPPPMNSMSSNPGPDMDQMSSGLQAPRQAFSEEWNPSKIFDQWNTAFGNPPSATAGAQAPSASPPPLPAYPQHPNMQPYGQYEQYTSQQHMPAPGFSPYAADTQVQNFSHSSGPLPYGRSEQALITPTMWHDAFTSTLGPRQKRRWDGAAPGSIDHMHKRAR